MDLFVVMTGGGIKAAVAAARSAADNELLLVHADYGQPSAEAELKSAGELARIFPCSHVEPLTLPRVGGLQRDSAAPNEPPKPNAGTDSGRPRGISPLFLRGLMPVLMSHAAACALRVGASTVVTGLSRLCDATHLGLPPGTAPTSDADSWYEFVHSFNMMLAGLSPQRSKPRVEAPLMDVGYAQIVQLANRFSVPLEMTWTCGQAGPEACGQCAQCKSRAEAFREAAMVDPLTGPGPGVTRVRDTLVTP